MIGLLLVAHLSIFAQKNSYDLNKLPLKDFVERVKQKVQINQIDLDTAFVVEAEVFLTKDLKIDLKKSQFTKIEADEDFISLLKEAIIALNDSGYVSYFEIFKLNKNYVTFKQNDKVLSFQIKSEFKDESEAEKHSLALKLALNIIKSRKQKKQSDDNDKDELIFLENATIQNEGKFFVLNFSLPQSIKQKLAEKYLRDVQ